MELFDYEDRLFAIYDKSRGFLWRDGEWVQIDPQFAGRVWAEGADGTAKAKAVGADLSKLPPAESA